MGTNVPPPFVDHILLAYQVLSPAFQLSLRRLGGLQGGSRHLPKLSLEDYVSPVRQTTELNDLLVRFVSA